LSRFFAGFFKTSPSAKNCVIAINVAGVDELASRSTQAVQLWHQCAAKTHIKSMWFTKWSQVGMHPSVPNGAPDFFEDLSPASSVAMRLTRDGAAICSSGQWPHFPQTAFPARERHCQSSDIVSQKVEQAMILLDDMDFAVDVGGASMSKAFAALLFADPAFFNSLVLVLNRDESLASFEPVVHELCGSPGFETQASSEVTCTTSRLARRHTPTARRLRPILYE